MPYHQKLLSISLLQLVILILLSACSNPKIQKVADSPRSHASLTPESVIMPDGYVLPVKTWSSPGEPSAVVLAVHGFNDYSNAFDATARLFAENLITTYAFDQRGFGATEQRGVWAGQIVMQSDLLEMVRLLCDKHRGLPVFLLGDSMGGAVVLSAVQQLEQTCIQGVILQAPAVWGWQVMPWWQTMPLRLLAHITPETTVTGEGLEIRPSDNDEMLRALSRDKLLIRETRIDAIYGLTDLMEAALVNSASLNMPALILYGEHDEIVPPEPFCEMLNKLPDRHVSHWRLMLYADGFHMLSRDLQGDVVIHDMVAWIYDQNSRLPSGQEIAAAEPRLLALSGCD